MAKQADLLDLSDARSRVLARFHRLEGERVSLSDALGRVLFEPFHAAMDVPPFANSSMDGFAVFSTSTTGAAHENPIRLRVGPLIAAGSASDASVSTGECARIMTGAPLPGGADAVVPFEEVLDEGSSIVLRAPVPRGACVRPAGNDIQSGDSLLSTGTEIGPAQIALLAALGQAAVAVTRRPAVAILATGDELVSPGTLLGPGQIYNSNSPMLVAAVTEAGGTPRPFGVVADDPIALAAAIRSTEGCDLLLTSGGASVGDFDHVKTVLGEAGEIGFWRVRLRPGKPLLFGSVGSMPVIGLPGNPTSAMVTFEQFVRPAIRQMLGTSPFRPEISVLVDERIDNRGDRRTFARVVLTWKDNRFHARLSGGQDSAMVAPLARAHGLLEIPDDCRELLPGDEATVQVWRLPDLT